MTSAPDRPLPVTDDRDTGGFWEAASAGRLAIKGCADCGATLHLPKDFCHRCQSWNTAWRPASLTATLHTWTVVRHQIHPAFPVPYTLVVVDLDDEQDVRLMGYLAGEPTLEAGQAMRARFEQLGDVVLPEWEPVDVDE